VPTWPVNASRLRSQAAWSRSATAACWSPKPPPAIRPGAVPTRGRQPQLRAHTAGRPVLRMVDQRGSLSFAGAIYGMGNRYCGQQVEVRLVGDALEIWQAGELSSGAA
jgi:hypothetical protein